MNKKLEEKIQKGREMVEQFQRDGIIAILDEQTGEVTVKASEFAKLNLDKEDK